MEETLKQKVEERTEELRESEESYKRMLNDLDVGFYKGEFKGKLLIHNAAVNKILGIKESQSLEGSNASRFFINEERREEYYRQLLQNGFVKNFTVQVRTPNEQIISIQLNSHLIRDKMGKPKEIEGTFIRLTDN
jgi:PAS domain S-box-containing protein